MLSNVLPHKNGVTPWCTQYPVNVSPVTPVPDSRTVWGLPEALSLTFETAIRVPVAVGVNVILTAHLFRPPSVLPHVVDDSEKSAGSVPVNENPPMVIALLRLFIIVIDWAELVAPTFCAANVKLVGVRTTGALHFPTLPF